MGWRAATGWRQLLVVYYVSFLDINLERISSLLSPGFGGEGGAVTYSDGARTVQLLKCGIFAGTVGLAEDERGDGGHAEVFMGGSRGWWWRRGRGRGRRRRRRKRGSDVGRWEQKKTGDDRAVGQGQAGRGTERTGDSS